MISTKEQPSVQEHIKKTALLYGNKAANLVELDQICSQLSSKEITISIPTFYPLSDTFIKSHLDTHFANWKKQWQAFVTEQGENKTALTPKAIAKLKELRTGIIDCFKQHPIDLKSIVKTPLSPEELFMVRSTGEEDTVEMANPGGNKSVAAVKPDRLSISKALGDVAASYLRKKSLTQRLLSGDDITKTPFMPALIQTMVTGPLVISGVMYADEHMTKIDAAPGHGELIVNSKARFDTFHVTESGIVYPEIHHKNTRLVPAEVKMSDGSIKRQLLFTDNPKTLQSQPSLPTKIAKEIADIGQQIKSHYGMSMDIEFVYQPWNKTLNIVQARPIPVDIQHSIKPSTLSPKALAKTPKISASVISSGGQAVKVITDKEQLLIRPTLGDALKKYLKNETLRSTTQAVLVEHPSASTSHEAAQFNALHIPVMQVNTEAAIRELKQENSILVIDPQRQQLVNVSTLIKDAKNAEKELIDNQFIVEGLFSSTLNPKLTLLSQEIPSTHIAIIQDYLKHASTIKSPVYTTLTTCLTTIETAEPGSKNKKAFHALKIMAACFKKLATSTIGKQKGTPHQSLCAHALLTIAEIHLYLKKHDTSASPQALLDLVSKLKALAINAGEADLYSDSVKQIALGNQLLRENKVVQNNEKFDRVDVTERPYMIEFLKLNQLALHSKTKTAWTAFVIHCCKTTERRQVLAHILEQIAEYQLHSEFINQTFVELRETEPQYSALLVKLNKEVNNSITAYKKHEFDKNAQLIKRWEGRYHEWEVPCSFDQLYNELEADFNSLMKKLVLDPSMTSSVKQVLLKQALALTEMLDKTIKHLKGSPDYAKDQTPLQVQRFIKLLILYHRLMKQWMEAVPAAQYTKWAEKILIDSRNIDYYNKKYNMIQLIDELFAAISTKYEKSQLHPSNLFSVESARVGTSASLMRQVIPNKDRLTAEDLFTWMHQNSLASIHYFAKDLQLKLEQLPEKLRHLSNVMQSVKGYAIDLLNISHLHPFIKLEYNIPIRNHSAKIDIEYNLTTNELKLDGRFFGHNDTSRMEKIARAIRLEGILLHAQQIHEAEYNHLQQTLHFSWNIKDENISTLLTHINPMLTQAIQLSNWDLEQESDDPETVVLKRHSALSEITPLCLSTEAKAHLLKSQFFKPENLLPQHTLILKDLYSKEQMNNIVNQYIYYRLGDSSFHVSELQKIIQDFSLTLDPNYCSGFRRLSTLQKILKKYSAEECLALLKETSIPILPQSQLWREVLHINDHHLTLRILELSTSLSSVEPQHFYQLIAIPGAAQLLKQKMHWADLNMLLTHSNITQNLDKLTYHSLDMLINTFDYTPDLKRIQDENKSFLLTLFSTFSVAEIKKFIAHYKPDLTQQTELFRLCKGDAELAHLMIQSGASLDFESIFSFKNHPLLQDLVENTLGRTRKIQLTQLFYRSIEKETSKEFYASGGLALRNLLQELNDYPYSLDFAFKPSNFSDALFEKIIEKLEPKAAIELIKLSTSKFDVSRFLFNDLLTSNNELAFILLERCKKRPPIEPRTFLQIFQRPESKKIIDHYTKIELYACINEYSIKESLNQLGLKGLEILIQEYHFEPGLSFLDELITSFSADDLIHYLEKYRPDLSMQKQCINHALNIGDIRLVRLMLELSAPLSARATITLSKNPELKSIIDASFAKMDASLLTEMLVKDIKQLSKMGVSTKDSKPLSANDYLAFIKQHHDKIDVNKYINIDSKFRVYSITLVDTLLPQLDEGSAIEFLNLFKSTLKIPNETHEFIMKNGSLKLKRVALEIALSNLTLSTQDIILILQDPALIPLLEHSKKDTLAHIVNLSFSGYSAYDFSKHPLSYKDFKNLLRLCGYQPDLNVKLYTVDCTYFGLILRQYSKDDLLDYLNTFKPNLSAVKDAVAEGIRFNSPELLKAILARGALISFETANKHTGTSEIDAIIQSTLKDRITYSSMLHTAVFNHKVLPLIETHLDKVDLAHLDGPLEHKVNKTACSLSYSGGHQSLMGDLIKFTDSKDILSFLKKYKPTLVQCHGAINSAIRDGNSELVSLVLKLSAPYKNVTATDFFALLGHPQGKSVLQQLTDDQVKKFITMENVALYTHEKILNDIGFHTLLTRYDFKPDLHFMSDYFLYPFFTVMLVHFTGNAHKVIHDYLDKYKPDLSGIHGAFPAHYINTDLVSKILRLGAPITTTEAIQYYCNVQTHPELLKKIKNASVSDVTNGIKETLTAIRYKHRQHPFFRACNVLSKNPLQPLINLMAGIPEKIDLAIKENNQTLFESIITQLLEWLSKTDEIRYTGHGTPKQFWTLYDKHIFKDSLSSLLTSFDINWDKHTNIRMIVMEYGLTNEFNEIRQKCEVNKKTLTDAEKRIRCKTYS